MRSTKRRGRGLLASLTVAVLLVLASGSAARAQDAAGRVGVLGSCIPDGQLSWDTGYDDGNQTIPIPPRDKTNDPNNDGYYYRATGNCNDINLRVTHWDGGVTIGAKVCWNVGNCQSGWTYFGVGQTGWKVLARNVPDGTIFYIQMYGTGYRSTGFVAS